MRVVMRMIVIGVVVVVRMCTFELGVIQRMHPDRASRLCEGVHKVVAVGLNKERRVDIIDPISSQPRTA